MNDKKKTEEQDVNSQTPDTEKRKDTPVKEEIPQIKLENKAEKENENKEKEKVEEPDKTTDQEDQNEGKPMDESPGTESEFQEAKEKTKPVQKEDELRGERCDNPDPKSRKPDIKISDQTINADKIDNFINLIAGKDSANSDTTISDFIKPLPESFSKLSIFKNQKDIDPHIARLKESGLILLVSQSDIILRSMGYTITKHREFASYKKKMLCLDSNKAKKDNLHLNMFNEFRIDEEEKMVVLIELEEQIGFFDSIFKESLNLHSTLESLLTNNILLICLVNSSLMKKVPREGKYSFLFHRWDIDFLNYLLEYYLPEEFRPADLSVEILKQREYGLWDRYKDEDEFYSLVSGYIYRGKDTFIEEVEKRSEFLKSGKKAKDFWASFDKIYDDDLYNKPEPHKTVLYTATFFKNLTPIEFEQVVLLLLKGETKTVEKEVQIVDKNEEIKTIKHQEKKLLTDEWKENADLILKECGLKSISNEDSSQYIEFSYPYLRTRLKKHIAEELPMYLRKKFTTIQESGILFISSTSTGITENVIRLSTEMALINPEYYGAGWLLNFIFKVGDQFNDDDIPVEDELDQLLKSLIWLKNETIKRQIYSRLANLIREMLNHSPLRSMISGFLNKLIDWRHHEEVLEIVWEIGKRLRFAPHFDLLQWLKRLMDEGKGEIKDKAYQYLLELAMQSKFQVYELLDSIKRWLPDESKTPNNSHSQRFAFFFILQFTSQTAFSFESKQWGCWPSKYYLFSPLNKNRDVTRKRLKELISWLLHPELQITLDSWVSEDERIQITVFLAELFEAWALILLGDGSKSPQPEAIEEVYILVKNLFLLCDKYRRKKIMRWWGSNKNDYRSIIISLPNNETKKKKELRNRYKIASKLISYFKEFGNQKTSI